MIQTRRSRPTTVALLLLTTVLAGCADRSAGYPSLAPRPIEQLSLAEPVGPAPVPQVADPAAVARFAPMIGEARTADVAFGRALEAERGALARGRGAATGSDAWAAAQVALSRIETAREPVVRTLADLDAARNAMPTETSTGEAIAASDAFEQVRRIDAAETDAIARAWPGEH